MKTIPLIVTILVAAGSMQAQQAAQSGTPIPRTNPPAGTGFAAPQSTAESTGGGGSGAGLGGRGGFGTGGVGAGGFGGGGFGGGGFGGGAAAVQPGAVPSTDLYRFGTLETAWREVQPGAVPSTDLYGSGLLSEEGDQDLHAAEAAYRQAIQQFDRQRGGAANAIFRLGEVYRKMGRSEEAKVQYARILREFPDMVHLTELSHARLIGDEARTRTTGRTGPTRPTPFADPATAPSAERDPGDYDRVMVERYGLRPEAIRAKPEAVVHGVGERGNCYVNLKNLGLSARIYAHAHQTAYPSTVLEMREEIGRPELLICQADLERQVAASWADFDPAIHMTYEYGGDSVTERDVDRMLFRCPIHGHSTLGDGSVLWQETTPLHQAVTPPPLHYDASSLMYGSAVLERKGVSWDAVEDIGSEIEVVHHIRGWLRAINRAKQQWALEKRQPQGALPTMKDLSGYMSGEPPITQAGERYEINTVGEPPVALLTKPVGNLNPGDRITIGPPAQAVEARPAEPIRIQIREDGSIEMDDERVEVGALPIKVRQQIAEGRRSVALAAEDQAPPGSVMVVINAAHDPRLERRIEVDGPARTLLQREAARWKVEIADLEQKAASLHQESRRLFDQNALLTRELREAEERVEPARQRLHASRFDPERLPGVISQDERYQKLRAEYEAAVLDGDEETGTRARARLSQWVERIYRPELEEELRFAHDTVSEIRSRQEALQDHRQRVDAQFNQIQERLSSIGQQRTRLRAIIPNLEAGP
jgi:predicted  nucleic acid-binding Zn-ribbon protein